MSLDLLLFLSILLAILMNNWKSSAPTPSKSNGAQRPCIRCGKPTTLRCSRCHAAYYCSAEHMTSDWGDHRTSCRKVFDALLFPVEGGRPLLFKLPYTSQVDPEGPYHDLDLQRYINGALGMKYVNQDSDGPALVVFYNESWGDKTRNQCIAELTNGRMGIAWRGNVVVLRQKGGLYSESYQSARMEDVGGMKRFFAEQ